MFEGDQPPQQQPAPQQPPQQPEGSSIPWQNRAAFPSWLKAMWETIKVVLARPSEAFSGMRHRNALGGALVYTVVLGSAGAIIGQIFSLALNLGMMSLARAGGAPARSADFAPTVITTAVVIVLSPVFVALGTFVGAGIMHLCLMIVGGANRTFETTFCVVAYAGGSTAVFAVIPFCGGMIGAVWAIVVEIIGLARAHETTPGRAALAVLLPLVLCCGAVFLMVMAFAALGFVGASCPM